MSAPNGSGSSPNPSTLCLSLTSTLRCAGLTKTQSLLAIIPPALEALLVLALIFLQWGKGRKHWFLIVESWTYLALVIVDVIAHIDERISLSLSVFSVVDRVIGAFSSVPLLCYAIFLLLYTIALILPPYERRWRLLIQYALIACIPPVIVLNEFGSLYAISYVQLSPNRLAVGFDTENAKYMWMFFVVATLATLIVFQFVIALFGLLQLSRRFLFKSVAEIPQGLGLFTLGTILGFVELCLAFAGLGFEGVISRRIIKTLSRLFLAVAVVQVGKDAQGFSVFRSRSLEDPPVPPARPRPRKGTIRGQISGPRTSTFIHVEKSVSGFYDMGASDPITAVAKAANTDMARRRVTIQYDGKQAPALELRFSELRLDDSPTAAQFPLKPVQPYTTLPVDQHTTSKLGKPISQNKYPRQPSLHRGPSTSTSRTDSVQSATSDSLPAVREVEDRFSGLERRVTGREAGPRQGRPIPAPLALSPPEPAAYARRKAPPVASPSLFGRIFGSNDVDPAAVAPKAPSPSYSPQPPQRQETYDTYVSDSRPSIIEGRPSGDYFPPSPKSKSTGKFSGYHGKRASESRRHHPGSDSLDREFGSDSYRDSIPEMPELPAGLRIAEADRYAHAHEGKHGSIIMEESASQLRALGTEASSVTSPTDYSQDSPQSDTSDDAPWLRRESVDTADSGIGGIVVPRSKSNLRTTPAPNRGMEGLQSIYLEEDHFDPTSMDLRQARIGHRKMVSGGRLESHLDMVDEVRPPNMSRFSDGY